MMIPRRGGVRLGMAGARNRQRFPLGTASKEADLRGDRGCASKPTWLMELNQSINQLFI